ncbi:S-adenosylmethionine:tRNA ribosyltransferase-isomerase [soil metagenome]
MTTVDTAIRLLPVGLPAEAPPEERGLRRDEVRLLVARPEALTHARFSDIGDHLEPGDVLVVNTSAVRPSALDAIWRGGHVMVHFSTELDDGGWLVEVRLADGSGPVLGAARGDRLELDGGGHILLLASRGHDGDRRIWRAEVAVPSGLHTHLAHLARHGRPISYGYVDRSWPLSSYQTVFADASKAGSSAESPSAALPFTTDLVTELISTGVVLVSVTLHTGVSSLDRHEQPLPERYEVPAATASNVAAARRRGNRVVAVGTTVARALETVTSSDGRVRPGRGWTELVLGPERPARLLTGLVTGWHEPDASHLMLLEAVAGVRMVEEAYQTAAEAGYLWHEFGDSCLFLP